MPIIAIPRQEDPATPAPGFDEPLSMLLGCHDRVRQNLSLLLEVGQGVAAGRIDDRTCRAAAEVLHYFDHVAPYHHEDEEQHVFPCVLSRTRDDGLRAAVLKLQEEHVAMEAQWARLRVPLAALANGQAEAYDAGQVAAAERFCVLYRGHARREEEVVFPLAAELLDRAALQAAGAEMARRRAARRE